MTAPANSRSTAAGRVYRWGNLEFPSVTTVLNELSKPQLYRWYADQAARRALSFMSGATGPGLEQPSPEQLRKWIASAAVDTRNRSADAGSDVHGLIENGTPGDEWPEEYRDHGLNWEAFKALFRPVFIEQEATVYSLAHGYAGTFDAIVELGGRRFVLDVKTGTNVYTETGLQLAPYRFADFIGRKDGREDPLPKTEGGLVLHLRADSFALYDFTDLCGPDAFETFLSVLRAQRWRRAAKKPRVIAPPMRAAEGAA